MFTKYQELHYLEKNIRMTFESPLKCYDLTTVDLKKIDVRSESVD